MISNLPDIIFLCGFMGAGKSTIGRLLSDELDRPFLDLDDKIEEKAGCSISDIFDEYDEAEFRRIERRSVLEVVRNFEGVVALGGGSIQNQHMLDHLKLNGLLIFIETPISVILKRISGDETRPLLMDEKGNPKDRDILKNDLQTLYEERRPLYEQAVISIEDDGSENSEKIVQDLLKKIRNHVEYH